VLHTLVFISFDRQMPHYRIERGYIYFLLMFILQYCGLFAGKKQKIKDREINQYSFVPPWRQSMYSGNAQSSKCI